jgi:hypothetical protein
MMVYRYKPSKSVPTGFLFVFLSLWIHSAVSFPTVSNSNPISRINNRQEVVCDDSGPLFCHDHRRRKHHRRHDFRLSSSDSVDESDSNDESRPKASQIVSLISTSYLRYLDLCRRRPFLTSSITAGILASSGDVLSQSIQAGYLLTSNTGASSFNWIRWRTFLFTGLLFEGPWVSFWYEGLWKIGRWMERKFQSGSRLQVLVQTIIDQTFGVAIFFPMYFVVYEIIGASVSGKGMYSTSIHFSKFISARSWKHACF